MNPAPSQRTAHTRGRADGLPPLRLGGWAKPVENAGESPYSADGVHAGARSSTGQSSGLLNRSDDSASTCPEGTSAITAERLSGLLGAFAAEIAPVAPHLADVLTAWPSLPEALKAGILAMVRAARK